MGRAERAGGIVLNLSWRRVTLRTAKPFRIATGVQQEFPSIIVRAEDAGHVGHGEAQPSRRVTGEDLDTVEQFLAWAAKEVEPMSGREAFAWLADLHANTCGNSAARCGVDLAVHDLVARQEGRHARDLHGLPAARLETSFTIVLDTPDAMAADALDVLARGYRVLKLKLGGADGLDVARVEAVRRAAPAVRLRVDANTAWTRDEAPELCRAMNALGVELVEQPLPADDLPGMVALSRVSPVPVYADESCLGPDDVQRLSERGFVGGVNLKLQKTGGLAPAVQAARLAREAGLGVMLGCMLESGCGMGAARQMLALLDHADLDGNLLLATDPFPLEAPSDGVVATPAGVGCGAG